MGCIDLQKRLHAFCYVGQVLPSVVIQSMSEVMYTPVDVKNVRLNLFTLRWLKDDAFLHGIDGALVRRISPESDT
jgi:hypothetical protein